jgi:membrane-bound metal-dependent hydrolase YbcI (DUF457 family)
MQTSAKGTYSGMLHCAGGILKNEGPLAFYKVMLFLLYAVISHILLGHVNAIAGNWCLRINTIWSTRICKADIYGSESS